MDAVVNIAILPVIQMLLWLLKIYEWILIITIFMSWINPDPYNPIVRFLYSVTEPVFRIARRYFPIRVGMIDLSPILVFLAISILRRALIYIAIHLAM